MSNSITYVAMDTHKKDHSVALHYPGQEEIVQFTVKNTVREIAKMVKKIIKQASGEIRFCYEAGVCGRYLIIILRRCNIVFSVWSLLSKR